MKTVETRCVVIGSGIAGLTAALGHGDCVVISKSELGAGSSRSAQGGIAAALGAGDDTTTHALDTFRVSGGLGDAEIGALVTAAAPDRISWLMSLGAEFDRAENGSIALGREAGHTNRRIVHAAGDATGAEIMRALVAAVSERPDIECLDNTSVIDLITDGARVAGVLVATPDGDLAAIVAPTVVIATGGIGQLYRYTTNPVEVAADGLAMAVRAGVEVRDAEFVQFHPTALDSELDPMPLLTEALRGEGAVLLDANGERFMLAAHDDAELAPRDIVARQIWHARQRGPVHLDARGIGADFPTRFPTVWSIAQRVGLDPRYDLLPVSPAEHYHMGGVATDEHGQTSMPGLFACGEAACTGMHGANRLASNSLLEGLVFGARVAASAARQDSGSGRRAPLQTPAEALEVDLDRRDLDDPAVAALRELMWNEVGLVRNGAGLRRAIARIENLAPHLGTHLVGRNLVAAARAVTSCALERRESRGSHFRTDHPSPGPKARHSVLVEPPVATSALGMAPARAGHPSR
jgi:L-aspartate oxidase